VGAEPPRANFATFAVTADTGRAARRHAAQEFVEYLLRVAPTPPPRDLSGLPQLADHDPPVMPTPAQVQRVFWRKGPVAARALILDAHDELSIWAGEGWENWAQYEYEFEDREAFSDWYDPLLTAIWRAERTLEQLCKRFPFAARKIVADIKRELELKLPRWGFDGTTFYVSQIGRWSHFTKARPTPFASTTASGHRTMVGLRRPPRRRTTSRTASSSGDDADGDPAFPEHLHRCDPEPAVVRALLIPRGPPQAGPSKCETPPCGGASTRTSIDQLWTGTMTDRQDGMTKGERTELAALLRRREKLAKADVDRVAAERIADFEARMRRSTTPTMTRGTTSMSRRSTTSTP
jgi:hypothetical protein